MKRIFLFAALAGLAAASCKKVYSCECKELENGTEVDSYTYSSILRMKKKDAETWCSNLETEFTVGSTTYKDECSLK